MRAGAHREIDFAQEQAERRDHGEHRQHEEGGDDAGDVDGHQGADEGAGDDEADQQRAQHGAEDGEVDEPAAAFEHAEFHDGFRVGRAGAHQHDAPAVDDAAEAGVERADQRRDGGQQEDRRNGQLDDARDIAEMGFHVDVAPGIAGPPHDGPWRYINIDRKK